MSISTDRVLHLFNRRILKAFFAVFVLMGRQKVVYASDQSLFERFVLHLTIALVVGAERTILDGPQHAIVSPCSSIVWRKSTGAASAFEHPFISAVEARVKLLAQLGAATSELRPLIVTLKHV